MINRKEFLTGTLSLAIPPLLSRANIKKAKQTSFFNHGVASGDPLQDRVIIWTRVSPTDTSSEREVYWEVAEDHYFEQVVQNGMYTISPKQDYTIKVDVTQLQPGSRYYYRFRYKDKYSITGTTQTLPSTLDGKAFNIAVVSCNSWQHGYFNAFRFLAHKEEVDMVLHLGDYIYEYGAREHGDAIGRSHDPQHEIVTLEDYRRRYAQYRTDPDLQLLHASKPFCSVWDDHEIANNNYVEGAQNHQPEEEGPWERRKQAGIQAFFEWLPVRGNAPKNLQRKITIGDELELYFLDQRMTGRTKQLSYDDPHFYDENRSLLGHKQYSWLVNNLKSSRTRWKLIANQVMITGYKSAPNKLSSYKDKWLGYPHERNKLIRFLQEEKIQGTVFLTGDHHRSFVLALHPEDELMQYTKSHKEKPLAWELLTPSVTSKNDDDMSAEAIKEKEKRIYREEINPHLVFADVKNHGYYIAKVDTETFRAEYFFVNNLRSRVSYEQKVASFAMAADNFLLKRTRRLKTNYPKDHLNKN